MNKGWLAEEEPVDNPNRNRTTAAVGGWLALEGLAGGLDAGISTVRTP